MPADALIDSPTRTSACATASFGLEAAADLLSHPEDEEQAVVGARAEHRAR